jgi:ubiquinone/menaquinone biosynthesis C-methylase UbiE
MESPPYELNLFCDDGYGNRHLATMPTDDELNRHYASSFDRVSYERRGKTWQGWHRAWRLDSMIAVKQNAGILDYGCGNGQYLRASRKRWPSASLATVEFPSPQLEESLKYTKAIRYNDITELKLSGFAPSIITSWHVIEHLRDPWAILVQLYDVLSSGGSLVVSTPNMFCEGVINHPVSWPWNQPPPTHLWHFSPQGIQRRLVELLPQASITVFTRDAWDANHLMDNKLRPLFIDKLKLNTRIKLRIDSLLRLAAVAVQELTLNPWCHRPHNSGAEIVVSITKK